MEQHLCDLKSFRVMPYRSKHLREYFSRMSSDREGVLYDDHVADVLKAQGFTWDESPRSIYKVDQLYQALARYAPCNTPKLMEDGYLSSGVSLAYRCFAKPKLQPYMDVLPLNPVTIGLTSKPASSAGLTAWGQTKAQSEMRALERGLQTLRNEKAPEPCIAFARTQFNDKTRLVWGYPFSMTIIESLIAYNINQEFKSANTPMAFAMTSGHLGTKLRVASYRNKWAYSMDMSAYDSSISAPLIRVAFDILRTWYNLDQVEPESGKTVREIFQMVESYFITTPIVMPDGNIYKGKRHGVPSGSFFTQIIDSIVNVIIAGTISAKFGLNVDARDIFVLGDDLLIWSNRKVDIDKIGQYIMYTFGIRVHQAPKSSVYRFDDVIKFLGRDWDNGLPTLDEEGILQRMVYPETYRKYSDDPQTRTRQVKGLLLSYAAVYWHAWVIVNKSLSIADHYRQEPERVDSMYYGHETDELKHGSHLSGLQRYLRDYGFGRKSFITTTAMQMWL